MTSVYFSGMLTFISPSACTEALGNQCPNSMDLFGFHAHIQLTLYSVEFKKRWLLTKHLLNCFSTTSFFPSWSKTSQPLEPITPGWAIVSKKLWRWKGSKPRWQNCCNGRKIVVRTLNVFCIYGFCWLFCWWKKVRNYFTKSLLEQTLTFTCELICATRLSLTIWCMALLDDKKVRFSAGYIGCQWQVTLGGKHWAVKSPWEFGRFMFWKLPNHTCQERNATQSPAAN